MAHGGVRTRWLALAVVALTVIACGFRPGARSAQPAPTAPAWPVGDRHSRLPVTGAPGAYDMDFADPDTGYVLFTGCRRSCPAPLYGTTDGGRTWQVLPLNADGAEANWLSVTDASRLAVRVANGYRVSRDGGHTFVIEKDFPADLESTWRPARLSCAETDDDGGCERWEVGSVATQPPMPEDLEVDDVTSDATGRIWAVAARRGVVYTAVSGDGGKTWRMLPEIRITAGLDRMSLTSAPGDREPWLVIGTGDTASQKVWAYRGAADGWRPVVEGTAVGLDWRNAVSAGDGAVALYDKRVGVLRDDGTWRPASGPHDLLAVSRLDGGSLLASPFSVRGVWVGARTAADFAWAYVTVAPI
jgi:hypothetical protein